MPTAISHNNRKEFAVRTMHTGLGEKALFGIVVVAIAFVSSELFTYLQTFQKLVWAALAVTGVSLFFTVRKKRTWQELFHFANRFYLPLLVIVVFTPLLGLISLNPVDNAIQALSTGLYVVIDMLAALCLLLLFKKKAVYVVACAIIVGYILAITIGVNRLGIEGIFAYISGDLTTLTDVYLFEKHDIGVAVVPLLLFFIMQIAIKTRNKKRRSDVFFLCALIAILVLCGKRSAFMGLLSALLIFYISKGISSGSEREALSQGLAILIFAGSFFYICAIKIGLLGNISDVLNINSMGRTYVYEWFSDQYDISPLYLGKGFQYVHCYMVAGLGSDFVNSFGWLHNSTLQIYIEGGFWGFCFYYLYYLIGWPAVAKKCFGPKVAFFVLVNIVSMLVIFLTDNVLTYPLYQLSFDVVILQYAFNEKAETNNQDGFRLSKPSKKNS